MQIIHSIALDFGRDTLPITIFAKQYDKESRFIEITPLDCGKEFTLESGVTARLQLTKPDGCTVLNTATIKDGIIKAELTAQTLTEAGTAVAEIVRCKGEALLSSQVVYIEINRAAYIPAVPEPESSGTAGTARYAWLRSPLPSSARHARSVNSSGEVSGSSACSGIGVAPACIIA